MSYVTATLEMSEDALAVSNAAATWADVSADLAEITWWAGIERESDEPQAGGATIRLKSPARKYEPELVGNEHIDTGLRFRLSLDDGVTESAEGVWYAATFDVDYPGETPSSYQEVVVTCVDGHGLLSLDLLPALDPPDATNYPEVVAFDGAFAHYGLDEPGGTRVIAAIGSDGVYINLPTLEQASLILGDSGNSVNFPGNASYARIPLQDVSQFVVGNACSVECWVRPLALTSGNDNLILGPEHATQGEVFFLRIETGTGVFFFGGPLGGGSGFAAGSVTTAVVGTIFHVVGTFDGSVARVYVNGVLEGTDATPGQLLTPASPAFLRLGAGGSDTHDLDAPALYEYALSPERVMAHFLAGSARGSPAQLAGERIAAVATSVLWAETEIQAGEHEVAPVMWHGQSKLEEILAAVRAEMPLGLVFFNGDGDPVYLPWQYQDVSPYNAPQATFGTDGGDVPYFRGGLQLKYDDEVYNKVTVSREGGVAQTAEDTASQAKRYPRTRTETGLIHTSDDGCKMVADALLDIYRKPTLRPVSLTTEGSKALTRTQILTRDIGDRIRVKRPAATGSDIDRVVHILKKEKTLDRNGHLGCTWTLSRGFDATAGVWRLGVVGFSELGETTVLA